jgi:hypothetical protein
LSKDHPGAFAPYKKQKQAAVMPEKLPNLLCVISTYEQIGDLQTRIALQLLAITFARSNELIAASARSPAASRMKPAFART